MTTELVMTITDELVAELEQRAENAAFKCCQQATVGAEYMGSREMICCGCPIETDAEISVDAQSILAILSERAELKRDAVLMMSALNEAKYRIEQGRVWNGMGWTLTGLNPYSQQQALEAIDQAMQERQE